MQVVILCGGKGTRAYPYTEYIPKPMLPVAGQPILLHVMQIYASQGHLEFVLSVGCHKEVIIDYFDRKLLDWEVQFVDTGEDTDTGGRIEKLRHVLQDRFMATYADGLFRVLDQEPMRRNAVVFTGQLRGGVDLPVRARALHHLPVA